MARCGDRWTSNALVMLLVVALVVGVAAVGPRLVSASETDARAGATADQPAPTVTAGDRSTAWGPVSYSTMAAATQDGWRHGRNVGIDDWTVESPDFVASAEIGGLADKFLVSPTLVIGQGCTATTLLEFNHRYDLEPNIDGAVLERSTAALGTTAWSQWVDLGADAAVSPYTTGSLSGDSPLAGRPAWTGDSDIVQHVAIPLAIPAGERVRFRWRLGLSSGAGGQYAGWAITNVAVNCVQPQPLPFLTAKSRPGQARLEWLNPEGHGSYACTKIMYTTVEPEQPPSGPPSLSGLLEVDPTVIGPGGVPSCWEGVPGAKDYADHVSLDNDTTYYYFAWVYGGGAPLTASSWSPPKRAVARPYSDPTGQVDWQFSTSFSALATPGIGSIYGLDNDRGAHSAGGSTAKRDGSGEWPLLWMPVELGGVATSSPLVVPWPVSQETVFVATDDGTVTAFDGIWGGNPAGPLGGLPRWVSADLCADDPSPLRDCTLQASPVGLFPTIAGFNNQVLIGTRDATSANTLFDLDAASGEVTSSFTADPSGRQVGMITGAAVLDQGCVDGTDRVYFASTAYSPVGAPAGHTLWCLRLDTSGQLLATPVWSLDIGDVYGSPALRCNHGGNAGDDRLYVATANGATVAVNAATGAVLWSDTIGDGAVVGEVGGDATSAALYWATPSAVIGVDDLYPSQSGGHYWQTIGLFPLAAGAAIGAPTTPLIRSSIGGATTLYVTAVDLADPPGCAPLVDCRHKLFEVSIDRGTLGPPPTPGTILANVQIGDGLAPLGSPALDPVNSLLVIGTTTGYYGVEVPLAP